MVSLLFVNLGKDGVNGRQLGSLSDLPTLCTLMK